MHALLVAFAFSAPPAPILWSDADVARVNRQAQADPVLKGLIEWNQRLADRTLKQGVETRPKGRLLPTAWQISYKINSLATHYRLTKDKRYARRAITEMLAVANFPDWDPGNFLGTAETLMPMAIGLSWCRAEMSGDEERTIHNSIVTKGLQPGLDAISRGEEWTRRDNNWAQVTAGALGLGAEAVRDTHPEVSRKVMNWVTREALPRIDSQFVGDGVPGEGPVYWRYGLNFQALLNRVTPSLKSPGYERTGEFGMYNLGPSGETFNFGDASPSFHVTPAFFELARTHNQPNVAAWARLRLGDWLKAKSPFTDEERFTILNIALWPGHTQAFVPPKLDQVFRGRQSVAFLRSSWTDPEAAWVAIKGGDNSAAHAQLDLGSFVYEQNGVRWLIDPGKDSYDLPGYFDGRRKIGGRWQLFRNRNEAHNTISFEDEIQDAGAKAALTLTEDASSPVVSVDLTQAYPQQVRRLERTLTFKDRNSLIIRDRYQGTRALMTLNFYTKAEVRIAGRVATLTQNGHTLRMEVPEDTSWVIGSTTPKLSTEDPNEGIRRLTASFRRGNGVAAVEIRPQ